MINSKTKDQLIDELTLMGQQIEELKASQKNHEKIETARLKELHCLYSISNLLSKSDISFEKIIKAVLEIIMESWQYPQIVSARIIIETDENKKDEYKTDNFQDNDWKLSAPIREGSELTGNIEIYGLDYTFLKNQGDMLAAVSELLSRFIKRKKTEDNLIFERKQLLSIFDSIAEPIYVSDPDTYDLLFANQAIKSIFGQIINKKCYQVLQDKDAPCGFCTNKHILGSNLGKVYIWEFQNSINQRWYRCTDRAIRWPDGRMVRCEMAFDINEFKIAQSNLKKSHEILESRVSQRTSALESLLKEQELDITAAKNILKLTNGPVPRKIQIQDNIELIVSAISLPCHKEGGDHFFVRELCSGNPVNPVHKTYISLKDQSGHKVGCILRSIITDHLHHKILDCFPDLPLEKTITLLNNKIEEQLFFHDRDFVTAINAELDHESLFLNYVSCGHPYFIVIRGTQIIDLPEKKSKEKNMPIGILRNINYSKARFRLQPGDKILFYTDGLTDILKPDTGNNKKFSKINIANLAKEVIGKDQSLNIWAIMLKMISQVSQKSKTKIDPSGINESGDDITLLGIELENRDNYNEEIWHLNSSKDVRAYVNEFLEKHEKKWHIQEYDNVFRLRYAVGEAVINAWKHGNQYKPDTTIKIRYRYGSNFILEITDQGKGFKPCNVSDPRYGENLKRSYGRGILIIKKYADFVIWNKTGNSITMIFDHIFLK